jgi:hypothetical protein
MKNSLDIHNSNRLICFLDENKIGKLLLNISKVFKGFTSKTIVFYLIIN